MEYENLPESTNIEDRRGESGGGGGLSLPGGGGTGGLGIGFIIVLFIVGYFTGIDPRVLIGGAEVLTGGHSGGTPVSQPIAAGAGANDGVRHMVAKFLGGTEAVWSKVLPDQKGVQYTSATLVLFNGATNSGCGQAQAAMGPFYCPVDKKVYLDTSFFEDMKTKFGGGGDFPDAYVIAHEIGHHVQDLLGVLDKVDDAKQRVSKTQANALSVRVELQADCYAGVWANHANAQYKLLNEEDVRQALATASAIGDDRLQTAARGYAVPDSFTHGSAANRQKWLTVGLKSGKIDDCNTFAEP